MNAPINTLLAAAMAEEEDKLLACVHCGLCLEACPTYVATGDENDSPRGRVYLMRAVSEGRLPSSSVSFERHIDRCLGCRACEPVCPAGVQYGQLLEGARATLFESSKERGFSYTLLRFVLRFVWPHPRRLRFVFASGRLLRDARVAGLLRKSGLARFVSARLNLGLALLESSKSAFAATGRSPRRANPSASHAIQKESAMLFAGCVTEGLFARVNRATTRVLETNGLVVSRPANQVCCGALHAHAGDLEGARRLARQNIEAFDNSKAAPVITNAGGCGAMLLSYGHLLAGDKEFAGRAQEFSERVKDVSQQLEAIGIKKGAPIDVSKVTYDASCHLLNGQRAVDAPLWMLAAIPDLDFVPLAGSDRCCGGAGVYNLMEADLAGRVLSEKLKHIKETEASVVATGNPGCQMQIGAGALLAGLPVRVCHPVELLDESYRCAGLYQKSEEQHE